MKIYLNPTRPFYVDKINKVIRMGNFPDTGKEINFEDNNFLIIIDLLKEPIDKNKVIKKICDKININYECVNEIIEYLISEEFVVSENEIMELRSNERYSRQNLYFYMLSDKKVKDNKNFVNKNILVLGLGGVGTIVCEQLVRAGFLNFTLVDYDYVEESNLIRQISYIEDDIGKAKVKVVQERLKKINNKVNVKIINKLIENENDVETEILLSDFVICTLDKPSRVIRKLINKICVRNKKPVIFSGFSEHVGMIGPFVVPGVSACLCCIGNTKRSETPLFNVEPVPSFGPLCSLIASIVTSEVINYYEIYKNDNLIGKTLMVNMYDYSFEKISWKKNKICECCGEKNDSK